MFIEMNPLEVDVGRKKRKADARYSLTSVFLGHLAYSLNGSCNSLFCILNSFYFSIEIIR